MKALILAFLIKLLVQKEDVGNPLKQPQLEIIADSIAQVAKTPEEAARLITMAYWESGLNLRVHSGHCKKNTPECDHGKARGIYQLHQDGLPEDRWSKMHGIDHTLEQTEEAHVRIERRHRQCGGDFESTAALYMGAKWCGWRDEKGNIKKRGEFYRRALAALAGSS